MATYKTVTVKPSGGDYTSLEAVDVGEATDLTAETGDLVVQCFDMSDTAAVDFNNSAWVTDSTHRLIIEAAEDHGGKWSTSAYRLEVANSTALHFSDSGLNHVLVKGLQIRHHGSSSAFRCVRIRSSVGIGSYEFEKCIFINDTTATGGSPYGVVNANNETTTKYRNCLFVGNKSAQDGSTAIRHSSSTGDTWIYNCTIDDWSTGVVTSSNGTAMKLKNTRITNCGNVQTGSGTLSSGSNYNLTDDPAPTNWGANSIDSTDSPTLNYVDSSNSTRTSRDYHLAGITDDGHEAGTDLSGDSDNPFTVDIDGTTRTVPWDIGIHELSAAGVAVLSLIHWRLRTDDGVEGSGGATFIKTEDVAMSIGSSGDVALDTNFRVRLVVDENNTGDPAASVIQVRAKKNGGAAFDVTGSSTNVKMTASSQFVDGAATTNHGFTVPGGSFLAGEILETDGSTTSLDLAQNAFTVIELCVQALAANLLDTDTLEFGLRYDGTDYFPGAIMATVVIGSGPGAATSFTAGTPQSTEVNVTWTDTNSGTAEPILWISTDAGTNWTQVATLDAATTSYDYTTLIAGTAYSLGITYWIDPNQSTMATDTITTLGGDQVLTPTVPSLTVSVLAITLSTGSAPTRDPPTGGGGGIRVIIRCG